MTRIEEIEARKAEIREAMDAEDADLDALTEEVRGLNAELATIKEDAEKRQALRAEVAAGAGKEIKTFEKEERKMEIKELRNSPEYIDKYAEYVKSGNDAEIRSFLTENVTGADPGTIAIPELVLDIVKTAWENEQVMSKVNKTFVKGNLKVNFEISAGAATKHTEGASAVSEESLVLGIANLIPFYYKKWKGLSDEAYSLRGAAFLQYLYNEIAHQITKAIADDLVGKIVALPGTATSSSPCAQSVAAAPGLGTIAQAYALLSDEAANPVIIMNRATWADFETARALGNYGYDPFMGLPVVFNNTLPAFSEADEEDVYAIVGDLGHGAIANFPNGEGVEFIFDPYSLSAQDIVKVTGKEFAAVGVVACNAFTLITVPESDESEET